MRTESDPTAKFEEQFDLMFWGSVPYHHPVVGWPSDVESITRDQAVEFFATYYAPNNITPLWSAISTLREALALAKKYFGRIPRGETAPPRGGHRRDRADSPKRRMIAEADTNPSVQVRWHTVPFAHNDYLRPRGHVDSSSATAPAASTRAWSRTNRSRPASPIRATTRSSTRVTSRSAPSSRTGCDHKLVEEALIFEIERLKERTGRRTRAAEGQEPGRWPIPTGVCSPTSSCCCSSSSTTCGTTGASSTILRPESRR